MEELKLACNKQKKEMEEIKEENRVLKKSIATLEQRLRNMEQYSRQTNIEINGVPETNGEHMEELLKDVASSIGLELKKERVIAAHRVPTFSRNRTSPIIVKFTTRQAQDDWLQAFKESQGGSTVQGLQVCVEQRGKDFREEGKWKCIRIDFSDDLGKL
ncbi:hypothetical protein J6590_053275 [Homalodisca vitripennis]|nr:hypothetical protein J6590_053275 [Homalodisca vitripennis]